jgi:hypothetical protein
MEEALSLICVMRLVDFLIQLLGAQAKTLQRLAALFGEEALLEILENAGEILEEKLPRPQISPQWFEPAPSKEKASPYQELEGAVKELNLSAVLEFHLWAYPFYRTLIESSIPLNSRIKNRGSHTGEHLVELALLQSQAWVKLLPLRPSVALRAERATSVPWLRFRAEALKQIGIRPIASL